MDSTTIVNMFFFLTNGVDLAQRDKDGKDRTGFSKAIQDEAKPSGFSQAASLMVLRKWNVG
jgi:hypothetical protein